MAARRELPYTHSFKTNETGKLHCYGVVYTPPEYRTDLPSSHFDYLTDNNLSNAYPISTPTLRFQYHGFDADTTVKTTTRNFFLKHCRPCALRHNMLCTGGPRERIRSKCEPGRKHIYEDIDITVSYPNYEIAVPALRRGKLAHVCRFMYPAYVDDISSRVVSVYLSSANLDSLGRLGHIKNRNALLGTGALTHLDRYAYNVLTSDLAERNYPGYYVPPGRDHVDAISNVRDIYSTTDFKNIPSFTSYGDPVTYTTDKLYVAPDHKIIDRVYVHSSNYTVNAIYVDCDDRYTDLLSNTYYLKSQYKFRKWQSNR